MTPPRCCGCRRRWRERDPNRGLEDGKHCAMKVSKTLKTGGMILGGLLAMAALFGLGIFFVAGATAASFFVIMKWAPMVSRSIFLIVFFILGPLSLIPPARALAAIGFRIASYVFGVISWCFGLVVTYVIWGMKGVVIGLMIAGVGVVPLAMLATLLRGYWQILIELVILIVLTFGLRALGMWLTQKAKDRAAMLALPKIPRLNTDA